MTNESKSGNYLRKIWVEELLKERGKENGKRPENGRYWEFRVVGNTDDQRNIKWKLFKPNMSRGTIKGKRKGKWKVAGKRKILGI